MQITINGRLKRIGGARTISRLLEELRIPKPGTAVAQNGAIIPGDRHETQLVAEGDRIDILRPIGGG